MKNNTLFKGILITLFIWFLGGFIVYYLFPVGQRSEIGDMFGAVNALFAGGALVGVVGAIMLQQKELALQREELKSTREVFQKQKFENTFFNLVSMQNQILNGIIHNYTHFERTEVGIAGVKLREQVRQLKGREFFNYLEKHLRQIYILIEEVKLNGVEDWDMSQEDEYLKVNIFDRYNISKESIESFLKQTANSEEKETSLFCDKLVFTKYQYKYAHYFRHLYRILKLIKENENKELLLAKNDYQKSEIQRRHRNYSKFVQAQMSTSELFILFYNSLKFDKMVVLIEYFDFVENLQKELLLKKAHEDFYKIKLKSKEQYFKW